MSENETPETPAPADPYGPETTHEYAATRAPNLRTRLTVDGKDVEVKFVRGVVTLDGPAAKELDRCIEKQIGGIFQHVRKMDRAAAIELAKQHAAGIRGSAAKGGFTSQTVQQLRAEGMAASGQSLADAAPNNPEELKKFADDLAHGDMLIVEMQNSNVGEIKQPAPEAKPNLFKSGFNTPR
jgi:hypothetical protein